MLYKALQTFSRLLPAFSHCQMLKDVVVRQVLRNQVQANLDLGIAEVVCRLELALKQLQDLGI